MKEKNDNCCLIIKPGHQALPLKSVVSGQIMKTIVLKTIGGQLLVDCTKFKLPRLGLRIGLTENYDCGFLPSVFRIATIGCLSSAPLESGVFFC